MLRKTILKFRKAGASPDIKPWRSLADDKSKFEPIVEVRQGVRCNSSDAGRFPPDDKKPGHTKTSKRTHGLKRDDIKIDRVFMKKRKDSVTTPKNASPAPSQKCQRIIAEMFGGGKKDEKNIDNKNKKSNQDLNLKSISNSNAEEDKLTQKIEKIKEVPMVAQHVEEFETTPKTLNVITCCSKMEPDNYDQVDKVIDDLASQCLRATPLHFDDHLLDGINKLSFRKSINPFANEKNSRHVKPRKHKDTSPTSAKYEKKHEKEELDTATLRDDTIPHPGAFLFSHITLGTAIDSGNIECVPIPSRCPISASKKKKDAIPHSCAYVFDKTLLNLHRKIETESYLEFSSDTANKDDWDISPDKQTTALSDEMLMKVSDFWEAAQAKRTTEQQIKTSAEYFKNLIYENNKKMCDQITSDFYNINDDINNVNDETNTQKKALPKKDNCQDGMLFEKIKCGTTDISTFLSKNGAYTMEDVSLLHKIRSEKRLKQNSVNDDTKPNEKYHIFFKEIENDDTKGIKTDTKLNTDCVESVKGKTTVSDLSLSHPCIFLFENEPLRKVPLKPNSKSSSDTDKLKAIKANDDQISSKVKSSTLNSSTSLLGYNIPDFMKNNRNKFTSKGVQRNLWVFDKSTPNKKYYSKSAYNDPKKSSSIPSPTTPFHKQYAEYLNHYAIRSPKSTLMHSSKKPVVSVKVQESKKHPKVVMDESYFFKKGTKKTIDEKAINSYSEFKDDLIEKISSHPAPEPLKSPNKSAHIWQEIVKSKTMNSPEWNARYGSKHPSEKYSFFKDAIDQQTATSNTFSDTTFDPPKVVFEEDQHPITRPLSKTNQHGQNIAFKQASKTLMVSSEISSDVKTDYPNIKMTLPSDLDPTIEKKNITKTLFFTRADPESKTNLKIQMDMTGSSLSKEFYNARNIFIKISDDDLSNNKNISGNSLQIKELEIITQDKEDDLPHINKRYASKSHVLQKASIRPKIEDSEMISLHNDILASQISDLDQHLHTLEEEVNSLMAKTGSEKKSNMSLLMLKLREKRRLETLLQYVLENRLQFAECCKRNPPKCPPRECPPRARCPTYKKQRRLNRSSCKPSNSSTTDKCSKQSTCCRPKSRDYVCNHPKKSNDPCAKCVAVDYMSENPMLVSHYLPNDYIIDIIYNIPQCFESTQAQLPIITGVTPLTPEDIVELQLPRRKSFMDFWNYKNFEPWVPIPSYEKPKEEKKRIYKFPKSDCKELAPPAADPNKPKSKSFPRHSFSVPNFLFVTRKY